MHATPKRICDDYKHKYKYTHTHTHAYTYTYVYMRVYIYLYVCVYFFIDHSDFINYVLTVQCREKKSRKQKKIRGVREIDSHGASVRGVAARYFTTFHLSN